MFTMSVVMPVAVFLGTAPDGDAQSWATFVVPVVAVALAILGLGYSVRRWQRPPNWARAMAKLSDPEDE